ncbi:MAG: Rap1a/Tai family immunity protein [Alphaproteobacteria bacterium]
MKKNMFFKLFNIVAICIAATQINVAQAQETAGKKVTPNAKSFYDFCKSSAKAEQTNPYCLGYISGFSEIVFGMGSMKKKEYYPLAACAKAGTTPMEVQKIVMSYFAAHETALDKPLAHAVLAALQEKFPCADAIPHDQ